MLKIYCEHLARRSDVLVLVFINACMHSSPLYYWLIVVTLYFRKCFQTCSRVGCLVYPCYSFALYQNVSAISQSVTHIMLVPAQRALQWLCGLTLRTNCGSI